MDIHEAARVIRVCDTDDLLRFLDQDPEARDLLEPTFMGLVRPDGQHVIVPLNRVETHDKVVCVVMVQMTTDPPFQTEIIIPSVDLQQLGPPNPTALDMAIWATMLEERIAQETNHPNHE